MFQSKARIKLKNQLNQWKKKKKVAELYCKVVVAKLY